jgi:chromosome segregation ATPase
MTELIPFFIGLIKDAPGYFVLTVGFIFAMFYLYIKVRSINIDEITSIGTLQSEQVAQLLTQVTQLSKDLAEARKEISTLYDKIDELENIVRTYRNKLRIADAALEESQLDH